MLLRLTLAKQTTEDLAALGSVREVKLPHVSAVLQRFFPHVCHTRELSNIISASVPAPGAP